MSSSIPANTALNAICPYFTMFPLSFPYSILHQYAAKGEWILDPFCGRGTTNYAGRLLGCPSIGIDSSPVAAALSQAKLINTTPDLIVQCARRILDEIEEPRDMPEEEFWEWAFHQDVLQVICRLREGLLSNCRSDTRRALRAILMGALHGPTPKSGASYFSNQSPRTYAPKPRYAVNFWKSRGLTPKPMEVIDVIKTRAERYYSQQPVGFGNVILGDSRRTSTYQRITTGKKVGWVITSPPYYGMRTYIPDQWLRRWFLGGPATVDYSTANQIEHSSRETFASELKLVWGKSGAICKKNARMVIRFGAINDRKINHRDLIKQSLMESGWRILTIKAAGSASAGYRQALHFAGNQKQALDEFDVWAIWEG